MGCVKWWNGRVVELGRLVELPVVELTGEKTVQGISCQLFRLPCGNSRQNNLSCPISWVRISNLSGKTLQIKIQSSNKNKFCYGWQYLLFLIIQKPV